MGFKLLTLALAATNGKPVVCNRRGEQALVKTVVAKDEGIDFYLEYVDSGKVVPIVWGADMQGRAADIPPEEEIDA